MYTLGIDIGSTATKGIILKNGTDIVSLAKVDVGTGTSGSKRVMDALFEKSNLKPEEIAYTIATGYGRKKFEFGDKQISELSCHTRGAYFKLKDVRTIIDIGGQDVKTIKVNKLGKMESFAMNEKCAAGTGRFLDVMAGVLETRVDQMGDLSAQADEDLNISTTCTVFAESEVISLMSNGAKLANVAAAIHKSVAKRVCGLAHRAGVEASVVMTGGVAQNRGVIRAIERELKLPVTVPENPQMMGALGAAILAFEAMQEGRGLEK
ncbi:acyl-CoA dehydratase activase [Eubacterium barkeri]|uniref:CoA-substrate-specific enzyme activase, putative n=1 Tax=Eubacterium barkeri TaxID=1528 RepID=A0A1H3I4W6_EUBBA|nr:acyl-CoA dehydratase activase [Eubacterium barkeri]SDY22730.1 CoA-substrate-specific enzyme activase, putative [Eubacterium barkeri]